MGELKHQKPFNVKGKKPAKVVAQKNLEKAIEPLHNGKNDRDGKIFLTSLFQMFYSRRRYFIGADPLSSIAKNPSMQ